MAKMVLGLKAKSVKPSRSSQVHLGKIAAGEQQFFAGGFRAR
jgi:hypothetical protein